MAYLTARDYRRTIQDQVLAQILGGDVTIQPAEELAAQEKVSTFLRQKFDLSQEFTNTFIWDSTKVYNAADRITLDYPAYSATSLYPIGSYCTYGGNAYQSNFNITAPEAFNIAHWTLLGVQYDIYYAAFPQPVFNYILFYKIGDKAYWKGKVYTALQATPILSTQDALQYGTYNNVPVQNIFPDDPINGINFWGSATPYSVPAGTPLTNTTYWTRGDNRNAMIIECMMAIVLYRLHARISPRNIPDLRKEEYNHCLEWLKEAQRGTVTPTLTEIQLHQGSRIRFGGNVKNINSY